MPQGSKNTTTESDIDENLFNLYPDPVHFVEMLKLFDRGDIASSMFVKLLEDYRNMKSQSNDESMRCISTSSYHPKPCLRLAQDTSQASDHHADAEAALRRNHI